MQTIDLSQVDLNKIVQALDDGQTMIYPTETCYGLGGDATNPLVVEKIFAIKGRSKEKSLIILASSLDMMRPYILSSPILEKIARTYWPGPLTVIVPVAPGCTLPSGVVHSDGTIAFRVTDHPFVQSLLRAFGRPLISTSANRSGEKAAYRPEEVYTMGARMSTSPDLFIDAGVLPANPPSTVIRLQGDHVEVVRQGSVRVEHL